MSNTGSQSSAQDPSTEALEVSLSNLGTNEHGNSDDIEAGACDAPPTPAASAEINQKEGEEVTGGSRRCTSDRIKKLIIGLVLVGIIIFVIVDATTNQYVRRGFVIFLEWIQANPAAGLFAFMGVYFVATVLFIPGSILTLGSGFVFASAFGLGLGVLLATVAVFVGAAAGAIVAFLLGRYLLRSWVMTLTQKYPVFEAIDKALEEKGFRIMALLRLSPIIPFNALNYIAGVTAVSLPAYCWSLFAILPGTVLYVFLGSTAGSLVDSASGGDTSVVQIVTIACGATFGILGIAVTSYYAKKELNKITSRNSGEVSESISTNETEDAGDDARCESGTIS